MYKCILNAVKGCTDVRYSVETAVTVGNDSHTRPDTVATIRAYIHIIIRICVLFKYK